MHHRSTHRAVERYDRQIEEKRYPSVHPAATHLERQHDILRCEIARQGRSPGVLLSLLALGCADLSGPESVTVDASAGSVQETDVDVGAGAGGFTWERSGYPIHVTWLGNPPADHVITFADSSIGWWSKALAPTKAAPFVVSKGLRHYDGRCSFVNGVQFAPGDTLAAGLHLYIRAFDGGDPAFACIPTMEGTSTVPMNPVGFIGFNASSYGMSVEYHELYPEASFVQVNIPILHEVGHVLGIGVGDRWRDHVERLEGRPDNEYVFTDSIAIAVFDEMADYEFPAETRKVPLDPSSSSGPSIHWDGCAGHNDLMGDKKMWAPVDRGGSYVTELTLSALAYGYKYAPAMVRETKLDRARWDWDAGYCIAGKETPPNGSFIAHRPTATFDGDVTILR